MCVQTPSCKKMQSCKNQFKLFLSMWSNCFFKEKHKGCDKVHQKSISHLMFKLPIHRLLLQLNRHQGWELSPVLFDLKKVKVEKYPFSGNRFPEIFKTPSPLLLLPPLLTSPSNQVDSRPPCSYISMTNPSDSPLPNIGHFCTKLAVISVQNRFVGRSAASDSLLATERLVQGLSQYILSTLSPAHALWAREVMLHVPLLSPIWPAPKSLWSSSDIFFSLPQFQLL